MKRLIREIHRRSLWQVLLIYAGGAWGVLAVVDTLAGALGLPDWAPRFALFLLLIGLPIVLATAFVQEGVGAKEPVDAPAEPSAALEPTRRSLFTWRNAILGGVCAFALWGVVATAWLFFGPEVGPRRVESIGAAAEAGTIQSIAVLPFADMSPASDQEYFSDGVAEQILDGLAKVPGLRVAARSSSFQFKGASPDVREVGQKLGVEAVLEGSVRRQEDRVRITAQLVSAEDGFHLWSDTYDRRLTDIFALQDEIARAIVGALRVRLPGGDQPRLVKEQTKDLEAYNLYLRGRHFWNQRTREGLEAAAGYFRQAVERDSSYALAWAALGDTYGLFADYGYMAREEALRQGKAAVQTALELDGTLAEAHTALASILMEEGDWDAAEREFRRALELNPNYATAHHWYGLLLQDMNRGEESLQELQRAYAVDPLSPIIGANLGRELFWRFEFDAALEQLERTIELDPAFANVYWTKAYVLAALGRFEEALPAAEHAAELNPTVEVVGDLRYGMREYEAAVEALQAAAAKSTRCGPHDRLSAVYREQGRYEQAWQELATAEALCPQAPRTVDRAYLYARLGEDEKARDLLQDWEEQEGGPFWNWFMGLVGAVYGALGDPDLAFEWLERAFEAKSGSLVWLKVDPAYDPLRDDPRFDELLRKVGLE